MVFIHIRRKLFLFLQEPAQAILPLPPPIYLSAEQPHFMPAKGTTLKSTFRRWKRWKFVIIHLRPEPPVPPPILPLPKPAIRFETFVLRTKATELTVVQEVGPRQPTRPRLRKLSLILPTLWPKLEARLDKMFKLHRSHGEPALSRVPITRAEFNKRVVKTNPSTHTQTS